MAIRNPHLAKLKAGYLFPEINKRKQAFLASSPGAKLISLGIGDTTEPLCPTIIKGLHERVEALKAKETYTGYGPEQGEKAIRERISSCFYNGKRSADEIFISDGSKCDIGRLQILFGKDHTISVQDPSYPVYVDTSLIMGQNAIQYLSCTPENGFFPDLEKAKPTSLFYFCSPNNPTGAVATKNQLKKLVDFCKNNRTVLIYDNAYAAYIQDKRLPKSIFEIDGAEEVAIELGSFSKIAGFTGVRLAYSVVPKALKYDDGSDIHKDWARINSTFFNGASNIAQTRALFALSDEGLLEVEKQIAYYLENARILKNTFTELKYEVY
ncbi:MAG: LL-diaminopimelate aminotransferase, partial [Parachlamydiaceae bacterium]